MTRVGIESEESTNWSEEVISRETILPSFISWLHAKVERTMGRGSIISAENSESASSRFHSPYSYYLHPYIESHLSILLLNIVFF
jgi:hypothetical protein